jgi:hypothetical protein
MSLECHNTSPSVQAGRIAGPVLALIGLAASACGGDSVGPSLELRDARLIFADKPSDAIVGALLPAVRVQVVGSEGRPIPFAPGRVRVGLGPGTPDASVSGRVWYELEAGEAQIDGITVGQSGDRYTLSAEWNDLRAGSSPFAIVDDYDAVRISRGEDRSVGLLVSGSDSDGDIVEQVAITEEELANAGILRSAPSPDANRIVAFARDRTPTLVDGAPWTPAVDTLDVTLRDRSRVHISVWFVHGGVDFMEDLVFESLVDAEVIWAEERLGLAVGPENPAAELFRNRDATAGFMDSLQVLIGERSDRINIYSVSKIRRSGSTFAGVAELGGNAIAVSPGGWAGAILAHEIGHNFGLSHVDAATGFDPSNVMFSRGGSRRFFSEGQTFRIHFATESALQRVSGTPSPIAGERFPPLGLRLWDDGAKPSINALVDPGLEGRLLLDCALSDVPTSSPPIGLVASSIARLTIAAREGPGPGLLSHVRALAADRFERRRDYLRTNRPAWLDAGGFARLRAVSREAYVASAVDRFGRGYRERATELLTRDATSR